MNPATKYICTCKKVATLEPFFAVKFWGGLVHGLKPMLDCISWNHESTFVLHLLAVSMVREGGFLTVEHRIQTIKYPRETKQHYACFKKLINENDLNDFFSFPKFNSIVQISTGKIQTTSQCVKLTSKSYRHLVRGSLNSY